MNADELHATAVHEAGHAVIGHVLGLLPELVTAIADGDSAGHVMIPDPYDILHAWAIRGRERDLVEVLRARILAFMAGREAEKEICGEARLDADEEDRYQVMLMLEYLPKPNEGRMRRRCRDLVRCHRASIEHVAAALMERGELDGEQIATAANEKMERPIILPPILPWRVTG